jgi:prophage tail gpP-like protein
MPKPEETAKLHVAGSSFEDWETVWVQHRWSEGWPSFRFTAAENNEARPKLWQELKFKPGDSCWIELGGQMAFSGTILKRQVAYDANSHAVELSGQGIQWSASTSSVPTTKTNHDNKTLSQITRTLYTEQHGVPVKEIGTISSKPFDRVQLQPGEKIFDAIDRLARHRMAVLGTDHLGNFLLIGERTDPITQDLIEGRNIKKMQCIISNEGMFSEYTGTGQSAGTDEQNMQKVAEQRATAQGALNYFRRFLEVPIEQPVKGVDEVQMRVNMQAIEQEGTLVEATVTVQGWLRDGVNLWRVGDNVYVNSPMALLDMVMLIKVATFSQDNQRGTQTELELVLPWRLLSKTLGIAGEDERLPQPPDGAKVTSDKPAVPSPPIQSTDPNAPGYVARPPISTDNMPPQPAPPSPPISH